MVLIPHARSQATRHSNKLHDFVVTVPRYSKEVYANSFLPRTPKLLDLLSTEYFPLTSNLNVFKAGVNRYLATIYLRHCSRDLFLSISFCFSLVTPYLVVAV